MRTFRFLLLASFMVGLGHGAWAQRVVGGLTDEQRAEFARVFGGAGRLTDSMEKFAFVRDFPETPNQLICMMPGLFIRSYYEDVLFLTDHPKSVACQENAAIPHQPPFPIADGQLVFDAISDISSGSGTKVHCEGPDLMSLTCQFTYVPAGGSFVGTFHPKLNPGKTSKIVCEVVEKRDPDSYRSHDCTTDDPTDFETPAKSPLGAYILRVRVNETFSYVCQNLKASSAAGYGGYRNDRGWQCERVLTVDFTNKVGVHGVPYLGDK